MMATTPTRRFTIRDMAILVVVIACSIVSIRAIDPKPETWKGLPPMEILGKSVVLSYDCLNRILIPLAPGVLMMRLAHPRPLGVRLWRQPGFVACMSATVATGLEFIHTSLACFVSEGIDRFWEYFWFVRHDEIKWAVFGAWSILILSRRWRSEASWVDRFGRGIGFLSMGLHLSSPIEWFL